MPTKLDQWRDLSGEEQRLLVGLVILLPVIGMTLEVLGLRRTCRVLDRLNRTSADGGVGAVSRAVARRMGRLVQIASRRGPYHATCLRQALALRWLLRRRGLPAEVRIGVCKDDSRLHAHAWVEVDGQAIGEFPPGANFAVYRDLDWRLPRSLRSV